MSRAHSVSKVRFSPEVSRSHSPEYWDTEDDQQQLLPKPVPSAAPSRSVRGIRGRRGRRWSDASGTEVGRTWVKFGMTFALGCALLVLGVVFGVIFWENEAEGTGGFEPCIGKIPRSWGAALTDLRFGNKITDDDVLVDVLHGAVSSDVDICSRIGVELLKKGGNAIDAAIGTGVCIGTVNSFASGVGGGGFMVVRISHGESKSFNFREMAPGNSTRNMYDHDPLLAQVGGLSVGIPGEVHGYATAHQHFGKLPWKDIWAPSIELNRNGFYVTPTLAKLIMKEDAFFHANRHLWEYLFNSETGELLQSGEIMKRPAYANTLEVIAGTGEGDVYHGVKEFYNGSIAEGMAAFVQSNKGILMKEDFGKYFTAVEETVKTEIMGKEVITCQPPCSGAVLIEGLNIAEGLDMKDPTNSLSFHLLVETMKWLSAGRTELGDPTDPMVAANLPRIQELTSKAYASAVRANISNDHTYSWEHYNPAFEPNDPKGTSHLSVLDKDGNAAALTTTVNLYWGAKLHDPVTGIVLNSQMDDFSIPGRSNAYLLKPSVFNYILPYKRPLSSMAPTIVVETDGSPGLVIGGSGGSRIVTGVFEAIIKSYFWEYGLLDTIKSPRLHHQLIPEIVTAEIGVEDWIIEGLRERGHNVVQKKIGEAAGGSVLQAVKGMGDGRIEAVADWWRKGGKAIGY